MHPVSVVSKAVNGVFTLSKTHIQFPRMAMMWPSVTLPLPSYPRILECMRSVTMSCMSVDVDTAALFKVLGDGV